MEVFGRLRLQARVEIAAGLWAHVCEYTDRTGAAGNGSNDALKVFCKMRIPVGRFMALGVALGAGLGAAFHNVAMGVAFGVVAGAVLSAAAFRKAMRA